MSTLPQANAPALDKRDAPSLLDKIAEEHRAGLAARYMPILSPQEFMKREKTLEDLRTMLVGPSKENPLGLDYGIIPGTDKPTLLLPGAQKACAYFGYVPKYVDDPASIEDWEGTKFGEPLFYYRMTCVLTQDEKRIGEGIGSCNSWESKYRYRWVREDKLPESVDKSKLLSRGGKQTLFVFDFALNEAATTGPYGKPAEYWQQFRDAIQAGTARDVKKPFKNGKIGTGFEIDVDSVQYRVPNADFADIINTVLKIAKKRSYIDATLSATGLSQYFTQDLEDLIEHSTAAAAALPPTSSTPEEPGPTEQGGKQGDAPQGAPQTQEAATDATLPEELAIVVQKYRKGDPGMDKLANTFLQDELIKALGVTEGPKTFAAVVKANPPGGTFKSREEAREHQIGVWIKIWSEIQRVNLIKASAVTEAPKAE